MHDLRTLLAARIPLVTARVTDVVRTDAILAASTPDGLDAPAALGHTLAEFITDELCPASDVVAYTLEPAEHINAEEVAELYRRFEHARSVLVFADAPPPFPCVESATLPPLPRAAYVAALRRQIKRGGHPVDVVDRLRGRTLTAARHALAIAAAQYGPGFDPEVLTRDAPVTLAHGLQRVNTRALPGAVPLPDIEAWCNVDGEVWSRGLGGRDVAPRGLLLAGEPGTGKTEAACTIARRFGVPLIRLDPSTLLDQYIGNSEERTARALDAIERAAPCVFLFDEVEKLLSTDDTTGTMGRVLAAVLWWLQAHEARVLTVMTCNRPDDIPAELVRPGRIDRVVTFSAIDFTKYAGYVRAALHSLAPETLHSTRHVRRVAGIIRKADGDTATVAAIRASTVAYIRRELVADLPTPTE